MMLKTNKDILIENHYDLIKVFIYDNQLKCCVLQDYNLKIWYEIIKKEDFKDYIKLNKSRLNDFQEFIYTNI